MAGWASSAALGTYSASKAALSMYAEALRDEVAEFGIQVGAIEPGGFRSNLLSSKNMKLPSHHVKDYDNSKVRNTQAAVGQHDQEQPGDVRKGINIMLDAITGTGTAEGKSLPGRLVVGSDANKVVRTVCGNHIKVFDDWESIITQTDHE